MRYFLLFLTISLAASCTWVKLTEEGEGVTVVTQQYVTNCRDVGVTTVAVVDEVILDRSPEKVAEELETLARNEAAEKGDTIVAASEIDNGRQQFRIYQCGN